MADTNSITPLDIQTVENGFYRGFNPVVAISTKILIMGFVVLLIALPEKAGQILFMLKGVTLSVFAAWYIYLLAAFVVFCLVLVALPVSARVRLGPDNAVPEHSTTAWLSMMFCAGIGIGILVFSVSEPLSNFQTNPDIMAGLVAAETAATVPSAMRFVYLHWGLSAWGTYAIIGLALGLACHRYGQPMTMRSALVPLFGHRLEGFFGHVVDVLSLLAIITGITTTIALGLEQILSGLSTLTGSPLFADQFGNPPLTALLTVLVVAISVAIASIISGPHRGVKWISQTGILLAFSVFLIFVVFGGKFQVLNVFATSAWAYVAQLPSAITALYPSGPAGDWQGDWTIFYWAWWIAFAPFVGLFLAQISYGRTLREFILGAMLAPTAMCFAWFAGTGGSALLMELDGRAGGRILEAEHAFRIYAAIQVMLAPFAANLVNGLLVLLFLLLVVASTTAAVIAIKSIGAAGSSHGESPFHSFLWAVVIAAITGAVMAVGGVDSIRDLMIVGAVPFSFIMALMLVAIVFMVRDAAHPKTRA